MKMLIRVLWGAVATGLVACGSVNGAGGDAGPGGGTDAPNLGDGAMCFGTTVHICLPAPTQPLTLSAATTIDTTTSSSCASLFTGGDFCVIAATDITVLKPLRATGARPLVLLASGMITTGASIDVGSHRNATPETGAGADPAGTSCAAGTAPNAFNGGGGAGGSFVGVGGNGSPALTAGMTSHGGTAGAVVSPVSELRGGCPGQAGQNQIANVGKLGHGGGAIALIAGGHIDLNDLIDAGGEGGGAGAANGSFGGGGGGGGAGGMIVLDAPTISTTSSLIANGGGGGAGGSTIGASADGQDGASLTAAHGGAPDTGAGAGGDGSAGATSAGSPGGDGTDASGEGQGGGGGGGGGIGIIKAPAGANLGSKVSPPTTP